MVFELVKNSLRAVQERFIKSDKVAPPIKIIIAEGIEDVTIKVLQNPELYELLFLDTLSLMRKPC